jgi:hypothetical protein
MHAQGQSAPAKSPANLAAFLEVLAGAGINLDAAGGSNLESGGAFSFAFHHDEADNDPAALAKYLEAAEALLRAGYAVRIVVDGADSPLHHEDMDGTQVGALFDVVANARAKNDGTDRVIKDVTIGRPNPNTGLIPVQVYSEIPKG